MRRDDVNQDRCPDGIGVDVALASRFAGLRQYAVAYQSSIPCGPDEAIDAADLQQQARPLPPKLIEKLRCDFTIWK